MNPDKILAIALGSVMAIPAAKADLTANLLAYYDFEQTGSAGLANKAPGATAFNAVRAGDTLHIDWATGSDATGPGFPGKVDYTGTISGVSDRSLMLVGKSLNLDDDRDEYLQIPISTADLGGSFTIAAWHILTPGASNASGRYQVFESSSNFDISWGTSATSFTTPQPSYNYLAYLNEGASFGKNGVETAIWQHVVHSFESDGTTTTLRVYVNGQFIGSRTAPTAGMDIPSIVFGRHRTNVAQDREWDGMMDEIAIWNRALSANDTSELFLRGVDSLTLTANLATANKGFIGVSPSDPAHGSTLGTELYNLGAEASISASASPGYIFNGWSGTFAGKPASFTHIVTASVSSVANFTQDTTDTDNDGLSNYQEIVVRFTDPEDADTDDDGLTDGAEVAQTLTEPLVSQFDAVQYILANLCDDGVQPGDTVLTRNAGNNSLTLRLTAGASLNPATSGATINPATPGVSATANGGAFQLTVPATADSKRFFRFTGTTTP